MNIIQYRVLEYAQSETEKIAQPFLIALKVRQGTFESYGSVLLDDWKSLIPNEQQADIDYIEDVLYDFLQQRYMDHIKSQSMFDEIAHLSSGPIRAGSAGECQVDSLEELHESIFSVDESRPLLCAPEHFASVLALLYQTSQTEPGHHLVRSSQWNDSSGSH